MIIVYQKEQIENTVLKYRGAGLFSGSRKFDDSSSLNCRLAIFFHHRYHDE